jgi:RNA polymerase sigma factor (sigma-70 family)
MMTRPDTDAGAESLAARAASSFRAYRGGDPSGMSTLVDEVTPLLWSVARQQGLDRPAAEDVVQGSWLKLVEHASAINDPQSVLKWLITTTKRDAWQFSARHRREEPARHADVSEQDVDDVSPSPEDSVMEHEEFGLMWQHFSSLSDRCKALLRVIAYADRPDYASVAEALGMPVGSIGPTRGRCLAKLRLALSSDPRWEMPS